jgi:two-component system response regulator
MRQAGTILLVEDNKDDELLTLDALRSAGVINPIFIVRDGQEAIDYLFSRGSFVSRDPNQTISLILLDLNLPKISGSEVLRVVKSDARTRLTPVVVLTTSSEQEDIRNSYDGGANGYMRKPVEFEDFLEAIRHLGLHWTLVNEPVV